MTEMIPRPDITCPDAAKAREIATALITSIQEVGRNNDRALRHFHRTGWRYTKPVFLNPGFYTFEVDERTAITITDND